jgi:hypothetical protein
MELSFLKKQIKEMLMFLKYKNDLQNYTINHHHLDQIAQSGILATTSIK